MQPLAALRQVSRRLGWGVADQGVSSLTNFPVNIYIARKLGAVQFGAFSLAYVTYSFALNASRGLATDPLLVRFSCTRPRDLAPRRRQLRRDCHGRRAGFGSMHTGDRPGPERRDEAGFHGAGADAARAHAAR